MKHSWTPEKIHALPLKDLRSLRDNAVKRNADDLVALCDAELASRNESAGGRKVVGRGKSPGGKSTTKATAVSPVQSNAYFVSEYHFVCRDDKGVRELSEGKFHTAAWAVSEGIVVESLKHGALVALHRTKDEPSYRQGAIVSFERVNTYAHGQQERRIAFLVEPTADPLEWFGEASGERGYRWAKIGARATGVPTK